MGIVGTANIYDIKKWKEMFKEVLDYLFPFHAGVYG